MLVTTIIVVWIENANSLAKRGSSPENVTRREISTSPQVDTAKSPATPVSIQTRIAKTHSLKNNVGRTVTQHLLPCPSAISDMSNIYSPLEGFHTFTLNGPKHPLATTKRSSCTLATIKPSFPMMEVRNGI